jgi:putative DNA primase/helicase
MRHDDPNRPASYSDLYPDGDDGTASSTVTPIKAARPRGDRAQHARGDDNRLVIPTPSNPMAVARRLDDLLGWTVAGTRRLFHWHETWQQWDGPRWVELDDGDVRSEVYTALEHAVYEGRNGLVAWKPTRSKVADVLGALAAIARFPQRKESPLWLTDHDWPAKEFVACANGLLHVPTRTLLDHTPEFFNHVAVPFPYDSDAPAPVGWYQFLDDLWHDDTDAHNALQEFFGYVISGRLDMHKILLLVGPTRAGKGVIMRRLTKLVGKENTAGPTLASLGTNFGLQPLLGKSLAVVADARLGRDNAQAVVERLLTISGEDDLTVDRKYRDPWTGKLGARFVVCSNELPRLGDASGAIAGRFIVLVLTRSWLGHEDRTLEASLDAELPGILNWALDGLDRLAAHGQFTAPKSSEDAVVQLQDLASPVSAFVRDRCVLDPDASVPKADLFAAWRAWCDDHGNRAGSEATFGKNLMAAQPGITTERPRKGDQREHRYGGIRLRTNQDHN